jgi:hypothetical protein
VCLSSCSDTGIRRAWLGCSCPSVVLCWRPRAATRTDFRDGFDGAAEGSTATASADDGADTHLAGSESIGTLLPTGCRACVYERVATAGAKRDKARRLGAAAPWSSRREARLHLSHRPMRRASDPPAHATADPLPDALGAPRIAHLPSLHVCPHSRQRASLRQGWAVSTNLACHARPPTSTLAALQPNVSRKFRASLFLPNWVLSSASPSRRQVSPSVSCDNEHLRLRIMLSNRDTPSA